MKLTLMIAALLSVTALSIGAWSRLGGAERKVAALPWLFETDPAEALASLRERHEMNGALIEQSLERSPWLDTIELRDRLERIDQSMREMARDLRALEPWMVEAQAPRGAVESFSELKREHRALALRLASRFELDSGKGLRKADGSEHSITAYAWGGLQEMLPDPITAEEKQRFVDLHMRRIKPRSHNVLTLRVR